MKKSDDHNQRQKEAILNECKGNLFEFLVAQGLAARSSVEDQFLLHLPIGLKAKLSSYQEFIRINGPKLQIFLPKLAGITVDRIWNDLNLAQYHFIQWNVIGKIVATNDNKIWNETDIVGIYNEYPIENRKEHKTLALSLKLTKDHSFTNTKSAGVKSFFIKYFEGFNDLKKTSLLGSIQKELNAEVNESFLMMGHRLYEMADLEFKGAFDADWSNKFTELPGELPLEMRQVVHQSYHRVALKMADLLQKLKDIDQDLFFDSLYALCGFGHPDIIQVNCFHQNYELKYITVKKFDDMFKQTHKECILLPIKDLVSSVEILMGEIVLQLRIKPMNKFTTAAYKINCSIKVRA